MITTIIQINFHINANHQVLFLLAQFFKRSQRWSGWWWSGTWSPEATQTSTALLLLPMSVVPRSAYLSFIFVIPFLFSIKDNCHWPYSLFFCLCYSSFDCQIIGNIFVWSHCLWAYLSWHLGHFQQEGGDQWSWEHHHRSDGPTGPGEISKVHANWERGNYPPPPVCQHFEGIVPIRRSGTAPDGLAVSGKTRTESRSGIKVD